MPESTAKPRPRKRIAKGPPRPDYLESPDMDRMMIMFVAMVSEMLTMRDRLHTHECQSALNIGSDSHSVQI